MSKYANSCSLSSTSRRSCQVNYTLGRVHEKSLKFEIDANEVTKRKLAGFTQVSIYSHSSKTVNTWETLWYVYCLRPIKCEMKPEDYCQTAHGLVITWHNTMSWLFLLWQIHDKSSILPISTTEIVLVLFWLMYEQTN